MVCAKLNVDLKAIPASTESGKMKKITTVYQFADWVVEPDLNQIRRQDLSKRLEPLAMNVLLHLLQHAGEVVTADELLDKYWQGRHGEPSMVTRCVKLIRSAIGDDAKSPTYIQTITKRGYRTIATVSVMSSESSESRSDSLEVDPGPGKTKPAIAVLAFTNMSNDPDNEYFSDGISEEILNALVRTNSINVIARTSSFFFKGKNQDIKEIASTLRVTHILEGSVRKENNNVRITTQLVDAATRAHLWSEVYDRELLDVFAVQDEIATKVVRKIGAELTTGENTALGVISLRGTSFKGGLRTLSASYLSG